MLQHLLCSYLKCCFYLHIIKVKYWKQPSKTQNKTLDLVLCVQSKDFSLCEGYSKTLADSRLLHCMVSAPFPATVLKQSKQIKVLQGITSQNTACLLHEYNICKCQKSRGSGELCGL